MSDMRDHPTAGKRRRHKSPAAGYPASHLAHPMLPDHLRVGEDGPTGSDEEKGAKRMRSASTTLDQSEVPIQAIMTGLWELPLWVPTNS